jgi:hypothetical protein
MAAAIEAAVALAMGSDAAVDLKSPIGGDPNAQMSRVAPKSPDTAFDSGAGSPWDASRPEIQRSSLSSHLDSCSPRIDRAHSPETVIAGCLGCGEKDAAVARCLGCAEKDAALNERLAALEARVQAERGEHHRRLEELHARVLELVHINASARATNVAQNRQLQADLSADAARTLESLAGIAAEAAAPAAFVWRTNGLAAHLQGTDWRFSLPLATAWFPLFLPVSFARFRIIFLIGLTALAHIQSWQKDATENKGQTPGN